MEWTEDHDLCLSQKILSLEPFKAKKGSVERGNIWDQIANNLNSLEIPMFRVSKRSVRERYTLLIEKLKKKLKEEEKASGIETSMSDVEKALEEIMEKESDAENTVESNKKKADHAKAVEMRKRAMESIRLLFTLLPRFSHGGFADQHRILVSAMTRHAEILLWFYLGLRDTEYRGKQ